MKTRKELVSLGMRSDRKIESMCIGAGIALANFDKKGELKTPTRVYVLDKNLEGFAFVWVGERKNAII